MRNASLLILLLTVTAGCVDELPAPPVAMSDAPIEKAKPVMSSSSEVITFLESEALRSGCGTMDEDAPKEFTKTDSGLQYRILRKSDGKQPTASDSVLAHYRGWLDNGKEFDSSYSRGEAITFPLNGVIAGWTEGLQLIGEGGMIELYIPTELGYGARGAGAAVPPNADLHFIVELQQVQ